MSYFFTAKELGFYDANIKASYDIAGTWPEDAKEISNAEHALYSGPPPQGKILGSVDELPAWVDAPAISHHEQMLMAEAKRAANRKLADSTIAPLQDALDLEMATDEEISQLNAWKEFRVLLSRIDISAAPDINWPALPAS